MTTTWQIVTTFLSNRTPHSSLGETYDSDSSNPNRVVERIRDRVRHNRLRRRSLLIPHTWATSAFSIASLCIANSRT